MPPRKSKPVLKWRKVDNHEWAARRFRVFRNGNAVWTAFSEASGYLGFKYQTDGAAKSACETLAQSIMRAMKPKGNRK
jgi:hypothetical protein